MVNLTSFLLVNDEQIPDATAVYYPPTESWTYHALNDAVSRFTQGLKKAGLTRGDRVALCLGNAPEFVIAYLAIIRAGLIVIPLNIMLQQYELEHQLADSGAVALITGKRFHKIFEQIPRESTAIRTVILGLREMQEPLTWQGIDLSETDHGNFCDMHPEEVAQITYTAAMDGYPRGAMLTHGSMLANCDMSITGMETTADDHYLAAIPLYHTYGAMANCVAPLVAGGIVYLQPRFNPKEFLIALQDYKITVLNGVPTVFGSLLAHEDFSPSYFATVRFMVAGGAAMPREISQKYLDLGLEIHQGYGLTECSPAVTVNPLHGVNKLESIGIALKNVELKVVDPAGNEVPVDHEGELLVKGPLTMKGYWNDPDLTNRTLQNGWLHTGDLARKDEDGYVFLTGLLKDMYITGGFNVYPREVERLFLLHPGIETVKITGVPDLLQGHIIKATVTMKRGEQATERELTHFAKRTMSLYKIPRIIEIVDEGAR